MSVETKEFTTTGVNDNGEVKEPTLKEELDSIVEQGNNALMERNRQDEIYKKCLGAIEILQKLIARADNT